MQMFIFQIELSMEIRRGVFGSWHDTWVIKLLRKCFGRCLGAVCKDRCHCCSLDIFYFFRRNDVRDPVGNFCVWVTEEKTSLSTDKDDYFEKFWGQLSKVNIIASYNRLIKEVHVHCRAAEGLHIVLNILLQFFVIPQLLFLILF